MRTSKQQAGRPFRRRGGAAEGDRGCLAAVSWDAGEYPSYCHVNAWSAVRLIDLLPSGAMPVTDGYAICGFFFC